MAGSSLMLDPIAKSCLTPFHSIKQVSRKGCGNHCAANGICEATARLYARYGAKVVIADIQDDLGRTVRDSINNNPSHDDAVSFIHCDVTEESDVKNAVDFVIKKHGKLDIMLNNAGIGGNLTPTLLDFSRADFTKEFDMNVYGSCLGAKQAARVMIPARKGSILFMSSCASVVHSDAPHTYTSSKYALVGLTKNLRVEVGQYGIRVNCISPFGVAIPMLCEELMGGLEREAAEEMVSAAANLKGAVLTSEDVAEAAVFLGSEESKYVSGMNMVIDGGYSVTNLVFSEKMRKNFGN